MSRDRCTRHWLCLLGAALIVAPGMLAAQQLVAGDTLQIRLLDRVRSHRRESQPVRAVVIAPLATANGPTIVPPGSILSGRVSGSGIERFGGRRHWLALRFDSITVPLDDATNDSVRAPISLRIIAIDNARETLDSAGRIVGPPIPSIVRPKRDWALIVLGAFHPVGALVLAATLEGGMVERHRAIAFEPGTEMTAVLTATTTLGRWTAWKPPPPLASAASVDSIVASVPLRAALREGAVPSDIIGMAVIGSAAQMQAAFAAAGWTRAVRMSLRSDFLTFVKSARGEGYGAQPVSELVLDGRSPDEVYEKVTDSFLKRHHFRVWHWPSGSGQDDGNAVWIIAATRDTGLMFSSQRGSFTHTVDPRIDLERDKIVSDLVAADRVAALTYARRAAPASGAVVNGGRAMTVTDWRMAVLVLK